MPFENEKVNFKFASACAYSYVGRHSRLSINTYACACASVNQALLYCAVPAIIKLADCYVTYVSFCVVTFYTRYK